MSGTERDTLVAASPAADLGARLGALLSLAALCLGTAMVVGDLLAVVGGGSGAARVARAPPPPPSVGQLRQTAGIGAIATHRPAQATLPHI